MPQQTFCSAVHKTTPRPHQIIHMENGELLIANLRELALEHPPYVAILPPKAPHRSASAQRWTIWEIVLRAQWRALVRLDKLSPRLY
jgi:hypothetical protein